MTISDPNRIPVIVGIGEITDRPDASNEGLEPLQLIERSARLADADAGGGWLARIERVDVVPQLTWPYPDLPALVADTLGIEGECRQPAELSGDTPVRLLVEAGAAVASGEINTALVCGGEAMHTLRQAVTHQALPEGWTAVGGLPKAPDGADFVTPLAMRYGLSDPTEAYTLYENATRAAWGQTASEAQTENAELWAGYAEVASRNPFAWDATAYSAQQIATAEPKNRRISYPYLKRMVAQMYVNQGAAFIVTSLEQAREAGVPEEQLIYVWSGAGASDMDDFLSRHSFERSAPMESVLRGTLSANGLSARDLDAVELYSCFPCVPRMALRCLEGVRECVAPSVAGGLSFFGGPLGNYMSHGITAMVRTLRGGDANTGLLYANGGYVTKHQAAVLARKPPQDTPRSLDVQPEADANSEAPPPLLEDYAGPARIESYMVRYNAGGGVENATIVAITPGGSRALAHVRQDDVDTVRVLTGGVVEPVGLAGDIAAEAGEQFWCQTNAPVN